MTVIDDARRGEVFCGVFARDGAWVREVVPAAAGRVLEIGFGSGRNLPFYERGQVRELLALEPSAELIAMARPAISATGLPVTELACAAEAGLATIAFMPDDPNVSADYAAASFFALKRLFLS